ncbi:MAG: hypothetical protein WC347_01080 [Smithellaceae bacterium]|jgi:hypothetical protein
MRKLPNYHNYLSAFISIVLLFLLLSCAGKTSDYVSEQERWQLFAEVGQGQRQLLINTARCSKSNEEGFFKCPARIVPSPQRVEALKDMITRGNREAGVDAKNGEQFLEALIKSETSVHDCDIACKQKILYLWETKQHALEYPVSESGPYSEALMKTVCESE